MKFSLKKASAVLLCVLMLAGLAVFSNGAVATETDTDIIEVSAEKIAEVGFSAAVQAALDSAGQLANDSTQITVRVPAGNYGLEYGLHIFDNTILDLRGVTVTRLNLGNMIRVGSEDTTDSGATGYFYRSITLLGGTLDGNAGYNTMIKAAHAADFKMEGVTLRNERGGHMMEVAGVDGFTAIGCTFKDQILPIDGIGYEAIQFDILHPSHMVNCRVEDLNMRNILVENCTFDNVPRGIGTHTGVLNNPFDGVKIRHNTFRNIKSAAVQGVNWINVDISHNIVESAPRGFSLYSIMAHGSGLYRSDYLSTLGGTESRVPSVYQEPAAANISIHDNTLTEIGTIDDIYAPYVCQGIAVMGDRLDEPSADEGGIPAGEYYITNVEIRDNYIDVHGHGIRLEETGNARVSGNEIRCAENTVHPANYYGIVLMERAQTDEITRNYITGAPVNGIQIVDSDVTNVTRNRVAKTGKYGISAYTSQFGKISENEVSDTANQGIVLLSGSGAKEVRCNRVYDCGLDALYFTYDSSADDVSANTTVRSGGSVTYAKTPKLVKVGINYTVTAPLSSYVLDGKGVRMGVGDSYLLVPDVRPVNAVNKFSYSSADRSVAAVDECGRITAAGVGETAVTVSSNGIKTQFTVEVGENEGAVLIPSDKLPAPKIVSAECVKGGIKLRWDAVDGAYGYRLYYRYGTGQWKRMKDTDKLTYTDPGVSLGRTETYTIRALGADGQPCSGYDPVGWSMVYQLDTPQVQSLQNTNDSITVRWNAVKGVAKYRVYFRNSGGGWTGLGTTTACFFADKKVRSGRRETYTVRGLDKNDNFVTDYNHIGWSATYVEPPVITDSQSVEKGIRLSWEPVAGAAAYRVYYRNTLGGWSALGDADGTSLVDTDVRSGHTYTYTIRALDRNGNTCSGYNYTGWRATFVGTPDFSLANASNGVRISWKAVDGAYRYKVFYRNSGGGWTSLGTVYTTSFLDRDVRKGGRYTYTVRCVDRYGRYVSGYLQSGKTITY